MTSASGVVVHIACAGGVHLQSVAHLQQLLRLVSGAALFVRLPLAACLSLNLLLCVALTLFTCGFAVGSSFLGERRRSVLAVFLLDALWRFCHAGFGHCSHVVNLRPAAGHGFAALLVSWAGSGVCADVVHLAACFAWSARAGCDVLWPCGAHVTGERACSA